MIEELALRHEDIAGRSYITIDTAEELAQLFAGRVINYSLGVNELRAGTSWANALDAEACRHYGANLAVGAQYDERLARRVLHQAGRAALKLSGTELRRMTFYIQNK